LQDETKVLIFRNWDSPIAYLQFVMHYSAIYSNTNACPNSKY